MVLLKKYVTNLKEKENIYHGNNRVKEAKIQCLKSRFEDLKMGNDEKVEDYLLKIDETINGIRGFVL